MTHRPFFPHPICYTIYRSRKCFGIFYPKGAKIMRILNIHGYNGSPENSAYKALAKLGHEIISPAFDYENESPDDIMGRLSRLADDKHPDIIVGTSLGGFYAAVLSAELDRPVITVNPFLMPFLTFPEHIKSLIALFGELSKIRSENVSCIVGSQDEVLGDHTFTKDLLDNQRFRIIEDGGHSGATLPLVDYFSEVIK